MDVQGKRFTVLGLGESGLDSALFLKKRGANVWVSESSASDAARARCARLEAAGIPYEVGKHSIEEVLKSDCIVISPGISPRTDIYKEIHKAQIEIMSEIELASRFCKGDIIAVTGTDGKTTTTTLLREVLTGCGMKAISCGNIGNTFIGEVDTIDADTKVVIEVSSFQLYHIKQFKPKVAVLTNIDPDHLDWHYNYQDYIDAKTKLFQNQTAADFAIVNYKDQETAKILCRIKAKQLFFNQFPSPFDPNREAALCICDVYGLDRKKAEAIVTAFPGVEHRLERVPTRDGIIYINDSKSTSLHSLQWGLDSQKEKVILICGGRNKGLDFTTMRASVKDKVRVAIVVGEAQPVIMAAWKDVVQCVPVKDVHAAVETARSYASPGDTILFSPACTSYDMFRNYKERGALFKKIVHEMAG